MIANLGYGALVMTLLVSLYGVGAAIYGARKNKTAWVDSARNAMLLTFPLLTLVALSIITLLVNGNYEVEYVYCGDQQQHAALPARSPPCGAGRPARWSSGRG